MKELDEELQVSVEAADVSNLEQLNSAIQKIRSTFNKGLYNLFFLFIYNIVFYIYFDIM